MFEAITYEAEHPDGRPDLTCEIEDPVVLDPSQHGILFKPDAFAEEPEPLLASCELARAVGRTATMLGERDVTALVHFGTYGCRSIAGVDTISQHALANAFDLAEVQLANGEAYTVLDGWEMDAPAPQTSAGQFWRELTQELYAQDVFHIILTPEFNAEHANHIHLDLTPGVRFLSE